MQRLLLIIALLVALVPPSIRAADDIGRGSDFTMYLSKRRLLHDGDTTLTEGDLLLVAKGDAFIYGFIENAKQTLTLGIHLPYKIGNETSVESVADVALAYYRKNPQYSRLPTYTLLFAALKDRFPNPDYKP